MKFYKENNFKSNNKSNIDIEVFKLTLLRDKFMIFGPGQPSIPPLSVDCSGGKERECMHIRADSYSPTTRGY